MSEATNATIRSKYVFRGEDGTEWTQDHLDDSSVAPRIPQGWGAEIAALQERITALEARVAELEQGQDATEEGFLPRRQLVSPIPVRLAPARKRGNLVLPEEGE